MVAAMSGPLRSARPCLVALLTLTLVLGLNGFTGAIHSVHHLPAPETTHPHETDGHENEQSGVPEAPCPVAAAAAHTAAITVEALPVVGPSTAEAQLVPLVSQDSPSLGRREPSRGRAPPLSPLLHG